MTYNCDDLHLETDGNGFILNQSYLNEDTLIAAADTWLEVKTDFTSIEVTRSVAVDNGVQFRPEASTMVVRTRKTDYMDKTFGKNLRLRWQDTVLFQGRIKSSTLDSSPLDGEVMVLHAVDAFEDLTRYVRYNFSAAEQTVQVRLQNLVPDALVTNCDRLIRAQAQRTDKLVDLVQEATDVQLARFYTNAQNQLVIDGDAAPAATVLFSDNHGTPNHVCYKNLQFEEDLENVITSIVVVSSDRVTDSNGNEVDVSYSATASHPNAVVTRQEKFDLMLPVRQAEVNAWAASFPVNSHTRLLPASLDTTWDSALTDIELLHLVRVMWKGKSYDAGIKAIKHSITPSKWNVGLTFMPGHLLTFNSVIQPSEPVNFRVSGVTDTTVSLAWDRPVVAADVTGFELRYNLGTVPPLTRSQGTFAATLPASARTFTHTGRGSNVDYAYSLWAVTSNALLYSDAVTAQANTLETIPNAITNFVAAKTTDTRTHNLTWTAPTAPGDDVVSYVIRAKAGAQPTASTYDAQWTVAYGATSFSATNLGRNKTFTYGIWTRTAEGLYGPVSYASQNTNETVPGPMTLTTQALNSSTVRLNWTTPTNTQDLGSFKVQSRKDVYPDGSTPAFFLTASARTYDITGLEGNSHYGFAVTPMTVGGLAGPTQFEDDDTPIGYVDKVWEGNAVWSRTYKADNTKRTDGSGTKLYYGYVDSFNGHQRSLTGFAVPGDVYNCDAIYSVELWFHNEWTYNNSGGTVYLGAHYNAAEPGTFNASSGLAAYGVGKPSDFYADITSWAAGHFRAGAKGVSFGPNPTNGPQYYGFASGGANPYLKIHYRVRVN